MDLRNSTKGPRESEHSHRQPSSVNLRQNKPFEAEPACGRSSLKQSSRATNQALRSRARLLVTNSIKAEPTLRRPSPWPRSRACLQPTKSPPDEIGLNKTLDAVPAPNPARRSRVHLRPTKPLKLKSESICKESRPVVLEPTCGY